MGCEHKRISLVYAEGTKLMTGGHEKDLVIGCADCRCELFRTSVYGKQVFNLLPDL